MWALVTEEEEEKKDVDIEAACEKRKQRGRAVTGVCLFNVGVGFAFFKARLKKKARL